jgi:hypothetical protein
MVKIVIKSYKTIITNNNQKEDVIVNNQDV